MNAPSKFTVERTGTSTPAVALHLGGTVVFMTEDTAQVLGDALRMVAFGEKKRLVVYEETNTRPSGMYAD